MPAGRQVLLRAGTRAFASHGFAGADVRSIAAAAGVGPNLIRVHFGSKAEFWEACLDALATAAAPVMAAVADLASDRRRPLGERLHGAILHVVSFYADHPEVRDFVGRHAAEDKRRAALVAERLMLPAYETLRDLFAAGIEAGFIRSSHPALFFAVLNRAACQPPAFAALMRRYAPELDPETARTGMIETIVATLLHLPGEAPPDGKLAGKPERGAGRRAHLRMPGSSVVQED